MFSQNLSLTSYLIAQSNRLKFIVLIAMLYYTEDIFKKFGVHLQSLTNIQFYSLLF